PGHPGPGLLRRRLGAAGPAVRNLWTGPHVLLPTPCPLDPPSGRGVRLCQVWGREVPAPEHPFRRGRPASRRVRLWPSGGVSRLVWCRSGPLPLVSVVCGGQAPPEGHMVELLVAPILLSVDVVRFV